MKKIILTGTSSFIGFHLALHFLKNGFEVFGIHSKNLNNYSGIQNKRLFFLKKTDINFIECDITNHDLLKNIIQEIKPHYFIHHGTWAKDYANDNFDLKKATETDLKPLPLLIKELKKNDSLGFILTSSAFEYDLSSKIHEENEDLKPWTPYGCHKLNLARQLENYALEYQLPARCARVFVPIGLWDNPEKFLPKVSKQIIRGEKLNLPPCNLVRDFIHVDDLSCGYQALLNDCSQKKLFDVFNLTSANGVTVRQFFEQMARPNQLQFEKGLEKNIQPEILLGSNLKAKQKLNWQPRSFDVMIKNYINDLKGDLS